MIYSFFIWMLAFSPFKQQGPNGLTLTVNVSEFTSNTGQAYVGLFNKEEGFPEFGKQYIGKVVLIKNQKCSVQFTGLPARKYAVATYHDVNKNGKLDLNFFGAPAESYGFSNNVRAIFSAPTFGEASVSCRANKSISITVQ
ncbi:MAG: DUF2141 domain-containing protein [Flavobacteriales bacterium]